MAPLSLPRTFRGQAGPLLWGPRECPPRGRYPGRRSTRDKGRARPASDGTSDPDWSPMRASSRAGRVHLTNSLRGPATRGGARPHQTTARCAFPVVAGGPSPCRPLRRANTPPSTGAPSGRLRSGAVGTRLSGPRQGPPWPAGASAASAPGLPGQARRARVPAGGIPRAARRLSVSAGLGAGLSETIYRLDPHQAWGRLPFPSGVGESCR